MPVEAGRFAGSGLGGRNAGAGVEGRLVSGLQSGRHACYGTVRRHLTAEFKASKRLYQCGDSGIQLPSLHVPRGSSAIHPARVRTQDKSCEGLAVRLPRSSWCARLGGPEETAPDCHAVVAGP